MHRKGVMDDITFKYLSAKRNLKPGRLYLLPKLNKLDPELIERVQQNPTLYKNARIQGRPIVSLSDTVLERIGKYLDKFMLPAVVQQETHLGDSLEFINTIEKFQVKPDAYLVSFDRKEMYSNITVEIEKLNIIEANQKINNIIFEMHRKGVMDDITFKYLSAKRNLKPGRLYLLPKLNKLDPELIERVQQNPTLYKNARIQGRPIVSLSDTVLERIGKYLDKFMLPAVVQQETHLGDSLEFINTIEKFQVKPDAYLVSFDRKEMYSNITNGNPRISHSLSLEKNMLVKIKRRRVKKES
ncbi:unnamed protein product [Mytilus coruscus]|uniref:Uncharacterized protein n=1 Tax=Mytilus coruscus TaxID=42192 RepID=A0A6J8ERX8_MYTCO|nr:unnamed protein product [Mytilus coruscus]